jgi:creatinine amidohydrolase
MITMKKYLLALPALIAIVAACTSKDAKVSDSAAKDNRHIFHIAELNTTQIQSLDKANAVVILVGGILEEHGPFLPSFTDGYWNEKFADTLATILETRTERDIVFFPTIPLGNGGANDIGMKYSFPGTYTVRFETLRAIFMDLALELGEQGFKNIVIVHGHGAPSHQRALDQAADFFNDTYRGRMTNLFGYAKVQDEWFKIEKTKAQQEEDGIKMHGGMEETSSILYLKENLVNEEYKNSKPLPGEDMLSLLEISSQKDWPGYFGSERMATVELGRAAWKKNVADFSEFIINIIEGRINTDTVPRFGDLLLDSKEDRMLDSLSLKEEARRKKLQAEWLKANELE